MLERKNNVSEGTPSNENQSTPFDEKQVSLEKWMSDWFGKDWRIMVVESNYLLLFHYMESKQD